jgi:hypothetical protein
MSIIRPTSLSAILDSTAEGFFYQKPISTDLREEIATMLISRQIQSGPNSGFFIPYTSETETQSRLFCGEQLHTDFARRHIQLIESARVLKLLGVENRAVAQSIQLADHRMEMMCYSKFCSKGECKALTIAYLRYLLLDGTGNSASRVNTLLANLTSQRDGKGKWGGFPFFYTVLMLSESEDPLAIQELQYAAPTCEKLQAQNWPADPISKRRQEIVTKALARSLHDVHPLLLG